jgi:uncharacterized protein (TIGR00251 family)
LIELQTHDEGIVLPVRAQPGARRDELRGEQNQALKVAVTQAAEKGKANRAIVELLSKSLGLRKSQIELLGGATSPDKRFLIRQVTEEQLREKLATLEASSLSERARRTTNPQIHRVETTIDVNDPRR